MREPRREPLASPSRERNGRRVLYPPRRPSLSKLGKKKKNFRNYSKGEKRTYYNTHIAILGLEEPVPVLLPVPPVSNPEYPRVPKTILSTQPYPKKEKDRGGPANYRVPPSTSISRVHLQKCLPCVRRSSWRRGDPCAGGYDGPWRMFSRRGRWGGSTPFALLEISGEEGRRKKEEVTANSAERARETERERERV